jgi:DNA-directed RNA polymerase specialized sigma24 family protein
MTNDRAQANYSGENCTGGADVSELLARVRSRDDEAIAELFRMLSSGLRLLIRRRLGAEGADARVRDTFQAVVQGIQMDGLRDAASLTAFVRETLQRRLAGRNEAAPAPAEAPRQWSNSAVAMRKVLGSLPECEREALTRFYVLEQPEEQVMDELGLSAADFRAMKARAKTRFFEIRQNVEAERSNP